MSGEIIPKLPKINKAVIDIGTNSTRMLVFREDEEGRIFRVNKSVRYTRMGQDVNKTKKLNPDAIKRNIEALEEYKNIAKDYEVQEIFAFGTSALRDAENTAEFIDCVAEKLGIKIEVVSGEKEAEYGFIGVSQCFDNESLLIFDIGGGSTELIYGYGDQLKKLKSLNVGCVRSTEAHIQNDPPTVDELKDLNAGVLSQLTESLAEYEEYKPYTLVGIGGTATTVSTIKQKLKIYDSEKVHKSVVTQKEVEAIVSGLSSKTMEERKKIVGLEAKRADIIIAGVNILNDILKVAKTGAFVTCDYDNLEGAAYHYFIQNKKNKKSVDINLARLYNNTCPQK